jgi:cell division control protein 45
VQLGSRYFELPKCIDAELLAHPLSLTKLCYFVMDSLKEQGRAVKPMICYATIPGPEHEALVVGVSHRPRLGAANGNRFGLVFRAIAE